MKIESFQDLKKIIALCRKAGVESIKLGDFELKLGSEPMTQTASKQSDMMPYTSYAPGGITDEHKIQVDTLSAEDLLFYSASNQTDALEQN